MTVDAPTTNRAERLGQLRRAQVDTGQIVDDVAKSLVSSTLDRVESELREYQEHPFHGEAHEAGMVRVELNLPDAEVSYTRSAELSPHLLEQAAVFHLDVYDVQDDSLYTRVNHLTDAQHQKLADELPAAAAAAFQSEGFQVLAHGTGQQGPFVVVACPELVAAERSGHGAVAGDSTVELP
jgi:hypothetical protein